MKKVIVKKIKIPKVDLYSPGDKHLGFLNEYQFIDVRVQIKENKLSGYYVVFDGRKIKIDKNGELEDYPVGLFDQILNSLLKLF